MSFKKSLMGGVAVGLAAALPATAQDDTTQIAFIPQIAGIPYYVAMEEGAQRAAEELGVEYVQQGPTSTNAADQLRIFESFVNQGFDVIAISPLDEETLRLMHRTIAGATEDYAALRNNTAAAKLIEYTNHLTKQSVTARATSAWCRGSSTCSCPVARSHHPSVSPCRVFTYSRRFP